MKLFLYLCICIAFLASSVVSNDFDIPKHLVYQQSAPSHSNSDKDRRIRSSEKPTVQESQSVARLVKISENLDALKAELVQYNTPDHIGQLSNLLDKMVSEESRRNSIRIVGETLNLRTKTAARRRIECAIVYISWASMGGDPNAFRNPKNSKTWRKPLDCCGENGITCEQDRIIIVHFNYNRLLRGKVHPLLTALSQLRELNFKKTQITSIPSTIGNLRHLEELNLGENENLKLELLPQSIRNLVNLRKLSLSGNRYAFIPKFIGYLPSLRELDLSGNDFTDIPKEIFTNLPKLRDLWLNDNPNLAKIPPFIGQLGLERLWVDSRFKGHLPDSLHPLLARWGISFVK